MTETPSSTGDLARIRQAFLLGLSREKLKISDAVKPLLGGRAARSDVLALLALAGQRQRFQRPAALALEPLSDAARRLHEDARTVLPDAARRALARLSRSVEKSIAGSILSIAARRIGAAGCRLHPFDLPELARHIKADAENLGLAERAYLSLAGADKEEDGAAGGVFFDRIGPDNWTTFPRNHRRAFVADLRRKDPAAGRALVETVWKGEPAPVRGSLLEAFAAGLGPDDRPFLESLASDRADSVKQMAAHLLARMPSTEGYEQRLAAAAACFAQPVKSGVSRLLGKIGIGASTGPTFNLPVEQQPKDPNYWAARQAARERLFAGLPLPALAKAVGITPAEILAALPADEHPIASMLLDTAVADGDAATQRQFVVANFLTTTAAQPYFLIQHIDKARVTLAADDARRILESDAFAHAIATFANPSAPSSLKDDGRLIYTATLMPRAVMPDFAQRLSTLNPVTTRAALDFAELVLALPDLPAATT